MRRAPHRSAARTGLAAACAGNPDRRTLAELRDVEPDMTEVQVENSLDQAMVGYRKFLEEAPESALTPEAMRRLADLKLEKEYGILGGSKIRGASGSGGAPRAPKPPAHERRAQRAAADALGVRRGLRATRRRCDGALGPEGEERAARAARRKAGGAGGAARGDQALRPDPRHLSALPAQRLRCCTRSRARSTSSGAVDEAVAVMERLIARVPRLQAHRRGAVPPRRSTSSRARSASKAEEAYSAITADGRRLRVLRARAVQARLDLLQAGCSTKRRSTSSSRCSTTRSPPDTTSTTRRTRTKSAGSRTPTASSASASRTSAVRRSSQQYFADERQPRATRTGSTATWRSSTSTSAATRTPRQDLRARSSTLHPLHRSSPRFSMRVVEIYEAGDFPKLVLESKKAFAATYGLQSEYWRHFDVKESPEVVSYLKTNLQDLASHYHALYQNAEHEGREARELRRGGALVPRLPRLVPRRTRARRRSTIASPICCSSTRTSPRRRASTSARRTSIPSTSRPRPPATPRSTRTARTRSARAASEQAVVRRAGGRQHAQVRRRASRSTSTPRRCSARRSTTCTR